MVFSCEKSLYPSPLVSQVSKTRECSREPTKENKVEKYFDTATGKVRIVDSKKNLLAPKDQALHIMQTLKIGELKCLVMYDSGANVNMIEGRAAEFLNLQVVDRSSTVISGITDTKVRTDFGTYKFNIGPTREGYSHEIIAHGTSHLSASIPKYNFEEINQELRASGKIPEATELPCNIGGTSVRLLLGVKDVRLQPKFLFRMDSGVAVFESPFMDVHGSRLCYGGCHPSLSLQVPAGLSPSVNLASVDLLSTGDRTVARTAYVFKCKTKKKFRSLVSVSSSDTNTKESGMSATGSGCVRKGIAPKVMPSQHSKQTSMQLGTNFVPDKVKCILIMIILGLFLFFQRSSCFNNSLENWFLYAPPFCSLTFMTGCTRNCSDNGVHSDSLIFCDSDWKGAPPFCSLTFMTPMVLVLGILGIVDLDKMFRKRWHLPSLDFIANDGLLVFICVFYRLIFRLLSGKRPVCLNENDIGPYSTPWGLGFILDISGFSGLVGLELPTGCCDPLTSSDYGRLPVGALALGPSELLDDTTIWDPPCAVKFNILKTRK